MYHLGMDNRNKNALNLTCKRAKSVIPFKSEILKTDRFSGLIISASFSLKQLTVG